MATFAQPANDALAFRKKLGELIRSPELCPDFWSLPDPSAWSIGRVVTRGYPERVQKQVPCKTVTSNGSDRGPK